MKEILELVSNYNVGLVIIGLFIYDWIVNRKEQNNILRQNEKCLKELSVSSQNTSMSLQLLQQTMNDQKEALFIHDKRCEKTQYLVEEIKKKVDESK